MLVPAKIARATYGAEARHALATTTTLVALADLTGRPEAAADAAATVTAGEAGDKDLTLGYLTRGLGWSAEVWGGTLVWTGLTMLGLTMLLSPAAPGPAAVAETPPPAGVPAAKDRAPAR